MKANRSNLWQNEALGLKGRFALESRYLVSMSKMVFNVLTLNVVLNVQDESLSALRLRQKVNLKHVKRMCM